MDGILVFPKETKETKQETILNSPFPVSIPLEKRNRKRLKLTYVEK
jgi:hypothetical protein